MLDKLEAYIISETPYIKLEDTGNRDHEFKLKERAAIRLYVSFSFPCEYTIPGTDFSHTSWTHAT